MNIIIKNILHAVSEATGVSVEDMQGRNRKREFVFARDLFCNYIADNFRSELEKTQFTTTKIGAMLNRNHSTVLHSFSKRNKAWFKPEYNRIKKIVDVILQKSTMYLPEVSDLQNILTDKHNVIFEFSEHRIIVPKCFFYINRTSK